MDTPYVRQYVEDREITAWFLLDLSPSVDFGTARRTKRAVLIDFVATLARLLTRHGNRVGAILYGSQIERTIPPRGGRIQVLRLINDLLQPAAARPRRRSPTWRPCSRRRAGRDQAPLAGLRRLRLHQRAGLGAPAEPARPPPRGAGRAPVGPARGGAARRRADPDGGCRDRRAALRGYPRPEVPPALRRGGRRREAALAAAFRQAGVDALPLSTDDDLVRAIVRFATLRRRHKYYRWLKSPASLATSTIYIFRN